MQRAARAARPPGARASTRSTSSGRRASRPPPARSRRCCRAEGSDRRVHLAARRRLGGAARHGRRGLRARGRARASRRPRQLGATQFEMLTAAAFADFAARGVEVAVVEAGLGGRLDATNVLGAKVVLLTNVGLEHTDVLGATREAIAREKLAVAAPGRDRRAPGRRVRARSSPGRDVAARRRSRGGRGVPRPRRRRRRSTSRSPGGSSSAASGGPRRRPHPRGGRLAARAAARAARLRRRRLDPGRQGRRRDPRAARARRARTLVATRSSNDRALSPAAVAARARRSFRARRDRAIRGPLWRAPARSGKPRARDGLALPACRSVGRRLKCIRCRAPVIESASSSSRSSCWPSSSGSRSPRATR